MIYIGSDHAGFEMKEKIKENFRNFEDVHPQFHRACDYPIYADLVCIKVKEDASNLGILICGTGTGMTIAANKHNGIRAANCLTPNMAVLARQHNDANILTLGARLLSIERAISIINVFVNTPFSGEERHVRRLRMIQGAY